MALITIDRPQRRNAVDAETAFALGEAWDLLDRDPEALVGVLTHPWVSVEWKVL